MTISWEVIVTVGLQVAAFIFILGKYQAMFTEQRNVLNKHEQAIDGIINRISHMNSEISYFKGWIAAKE